MKLASAILAITLLAAAPVSAAIVSVAITGEVEYNLVSIGQFGAVNPGDPVLIMFEVDSDNFVDSVSFPTRAYVIDHASFSVTVGPATASLFSPFPGTPYFVVRDNDPAVDGFFLSKGTDFPSGLNLDEPANGAGTRFFESRFNVTYGGSRLSSLDIAQAGGLYDFTGLTVFGFAIDDLGFDPIGIIFEQMTISVDSVPVEETSWGRVKSLY